MTHRFLLICLSVILLFPPYVKAAPKEIFTDPVTGYQIWRMTNASQRDIVQYYDHPTISPNGRYLIFRTSRTPFIYIISSDGTGEKPIGDYSVWNSQRNIDFSKNNLQGWWSHDSRYYYAYHKLYVIDIEKFQNNSPPDEYISQISPTRGEGFYYPMLSPDGRTLYGVSISSDSRSGGTLKFIDIDGANYREFPPPFYGVPGSVALDVTHGWLGNDQAWYMNDDMDNYLNSQLVFNVADGTAAGQNPRLEVRDPAVTDSWWGILNHMIVSPSGYFIGHGEGYVAGHGRSTKYANTNYLSQNSATRNLTTISPVNAFHFSFSPDAKWISTVEDRGSNTGYLMVYPINPVASPIKVARVFVNDPGSYDISPEPLFSPDGTKLVYYGDIREANNYDIYMTIFKKPDPPTNVTATLSGNSVILNWKPANMHREIKEYQIQRATTSNGTYQTIATVPITQTYLNVPSKLSASASVITLDTTTNFPASGVIEISGLSSEIPNELISCTGKTTTTLTGCTRGVQGTTAAEHYNDSFVWSYTASNQYTDSSPITNGWYRLRAVEWSGLTSDYSIPINTITPVSPTPSPFDTDQDGDHDFLDFITLILWEDIKQIFEYNQFLRLFGN